NSAASCGTTCGNRVACSTTNGTATCASGTCGINCSSGYGNCDGDASNGCEVNLNSAASCGTTCGNRVMCSTTNGTATCASGACGITCSSGYGNCDGNASNGCEVNTNTNASHCGSCNSPCTTPPSATCVNASTRRTYPPSGTCSAGTCAFTPTDTVCPSGTCSGGACVATSCVTSGAGLTDCGSGNDQDCCTSLLVPGGTFYRSYDGVSSGYTSQSYPATVSDFRLDKYEVTVGRFRAFKAAWDGGWRPAAGAGKHTHLNGGQGLSAPGGGSYEAGWSSAWDASVAPTDANLNCGVYQTWTTAAGANERLPMNCANWYENHAFCVWDGGFLPSEAEWNYVAAGGSEQRVYPWSVPASSTSIGCTNASFDCSNNSCGDGVAGCTLEDLIVVGMKPGGDGRWGQTELGGNVWEWSLDYWTTPYPNGTCDNCATIASPSDRVVRGGGFIDGTSNLLASSRFYGTPTGRDYHIGARCARTP
ncbi:MAG: formylglycine-generating enzyme family protein, partial [Polyangiaceae bacterium]|nr:formylglycine-generating enzyme family protein [Polyangiaceae bacterium]